MQNTSITQQLLGNNTMSLVKKYQLVGSAGTLDQLVKLIETRWGWSISSTPELSKDVYGIDLKNHHVTDCRIVFKKGRYRFEMPVGQ